MFRKNKNFIRILILAIVFGLLPNVAVPINAAEPLAFDSPMFTRTAEGEAPETGVSKLKAGKTSFSIHAVNSGMEKDVILAVALFQNSDLETIAFDKETVAGAATLSAEIEVPQDTLDDYVLKAFVFDAVASLRVVSDVYVLTAIDSDKQINSFQVAIGGHTYEGLIDQDTKKITVEVPTRITTNTGTAVHKNLLSPDAFAEGKTNIIPVIEASDDAVVSDLDAAKDFTAPQQYTVTAPNGSSNTYLVSIDETIIKRSHDIQTAELIIPGHRFANVAERLGTPVSGTLGDGRWGQQGIKYEKGDDGAYTGDYATDTAGRSEIVEDPADPAKKVMHMEKIQKETMKMFSTLGYEKITGVTKFTVGARLRFADISAGDGVIIYLANRNGIVLKRNEEGNGFILRSRKDWQGTPKNIVTKTPFFAFDQWYDFKFIHYNTKNEDGTFTGTVEIYVDGKLEGTVTNTYTSDISFKNHMEFTSFKSTLFDMYWDDMSVSYQLEEN